MADESPEQTRERVHAEELAKGSDPRVAEGRAKAAELRAKAGLPIEPDLAWRAKLEQEGGAPSAAPTTTAGEAPPEAEPAEPEPGEEPEAAEAEPEPEPAAAPTGPAPVPTSQAPAAAPAVPEPAVPGREPEVGEPMEVETEGLEVVGGIPIQQRRLPLWVSAVIIGLLLWAASYGLFVSGEDSIQKTTGCRVDAERALVCAPAEPESTPGG